MDNITDILTSIFVSKRAKQSSVVKIKTGENESQSGSSESASCSSESHSESSSCSSDSSSESSSCSSKSTRSVSGKSPVWQNYEKFVPEVYKKNCLFINEQRSNNIKSLSDMLQNLSKLYNINVTYKPEITIITSNENKQSFKVMQLDNPHIYFTDFVFTTDIKFSDDRRHLVVVDLDALDDDDVGRLEELCDTPNVHLAVVYGSYDNQATQIFKLLGKGAILFHRKDRLKQPQQRFYNNILTKVTKLDKNDYFDLINDEHLNVSSFIIKDEELKYN